MTENRVPGDRLTTALRVLSGAGVDLDVQQALDVLWLAGRLPAEHAPLRRHVAPPAAEEPAPQAAPQVPAAPSVPESGAPATAPAPQAERELFAAARPLPTPDLLPPRRSRTFGGRTGEQRRARPLRIPESGAFLDELAVGRALRPLRRRHPSLHRMEIDEARTAAALAETLLPDVVLRPARERWLSLVLVVDDGVSMLLWHKITAELKTLMLRLGAFASVRVLGLDSRSATAPRLHTRPFARRSPTVSPASLLDLSGRTLVLAVSDGMGAAWRSGALHRTLATWARRGPVALLHTLPPPLWESSGIRAERWQATTRRIGGANTSWIVTDRILPRDLAPFDGVPVPVLEPLADSLSDWAALLASPGTTVELPLLSPAGGDAHPGAQDRGSVQHFRDSATPEAYRLAAHLAAVAPVSVPVMHLVQQAVPWHARTSHLAEVFLGGLVRPHPAPVSDPLPKHRVFEFTEEARQVLLDSVPHAELLRTGRRIGSQLEQLAGRNADFPAWLAQPDGIAVIPVAHRAFSTVEQRLLRRFGVGARRLAEAGAGALAQGGTDPTDDWSALTGDDPGRIGPYELLGRRRGRRTIAYLARDDEGGHLVVRTPRPDAPPDADRLLHVEAEALRRLAGRHAPRLLATGLGAQPPWLAMELLADDDAPSAQPPRLSEVFARALENGRPAFDLLQGLAVSHQLAGALSICHLNGLVPERLTAESVLVRRRSVILWDLSDSVVDGEHHGHGRPPVRADNVRALGELLQLIGSRPRLNRPGLSTAMELWQGDTWESLRRVIGRCLDDNPEARPSAGDVADLLARYLALSDSSGVVHADLPLVRVPLEEPEPGAAPEPGSDDHQPRGPGLRNMWRGFGKAKDEELIASLRIPLGHGPRITLIGAHPYSGRSTATLTLGSLIAAVRRRPVLALDGAPEAGALAAYLPGGRNPATFRDAGSLPPGASYDAVRALTTRLPSGLEVVAHRVGHFTPSPTHAQEYARLVGAAAPHYSAVLTDWGARRLGEWVEPVLELTDTLVMCCMYPVAVSEWSGQLMAELRARGHEALVEEALVLVIGSATALSDLDLGVTAHQLGVSRHQLIQVPFDPAFVDPGFPGLGRLRPRTVRAFAHTGARLLARAEA
ncbi:SAV_2336 N-terminal domain-related protein [Streptomyces sp. HUAS MG91]|uniref:SAV_2336 N-terminal domain-related protein n=1 Tax=Streptomyces tabacisoli TaxID=3156398 RepID=A0AAU8J2D2_9ACTN